MRYTEARVTPVNFCRRDEAGKPLRDANGRVVSDTQYVASFGYRPPMEDMFETLTHPVHFRDEGRCQAFVDRVNAARDKGRVPQIEQWCFAGSICSPFGAEGFGPAPYSVL